VDKDGNTRWLDQRNTYLKDREGKLIAIQGIIRNNTERKLGEEELRQYKEGLEQLVAERTKELEYKTKALEEINIAMKVLLQTREEEKGEQEDRFVMNVRNLIMPYAEKLKGSDLDERQSAYLGIIEDNLREITSSMLKKMHHYNFTRTEHEVALLIKAGKSTKEIASIMGIASSSIDTHRNNIRKKLGISLKKENLRSLLLSLD
jgi:DNA-binding CsgD family transcriptional regulator